MRVLVACEFSGVVREAFMQYHGVEAMSCDMLPAEDGRDDYHYCGDVRDIIGDGWDLMIAHPPCTYLNSAGLHWITRGRIEPDGRPRIEHQLEALDFVRLMLSAPIPRIALENPVGCINTKIPEAPKPQYIQPYDFGEDASKKTGLWLKGLPPLLKTKRIPGRIVEWESKRVERWANQTDSGQNVLPPSADRGHLRSVSYPGIASAMAEQWIPHLLQK